MTQADAGSILGRAGVWTAELRDHGQISDELVDRLNGVLAESFGERLDQPDDPLLVVMLCGPTAVGKSSLINALAGADISRPGTGAATRAAVLYVHEQDDPARLFAYGHGLGGRDQPDTRLVRHRRDELLHKVLVDTPDIDSVRLQHRALTAGLVHAADLVLFVTSPEKYKVMRSARWVGEQRHQRALGFVLNKWDRAGLGAQSQHRDVVETDFRHVLAQEGFAEPIVFKVSAQEEAETFENQLPALRRWLEAGLAASTAAEIRRRRLRAAWGRLAALIEAAEPQPLSGHALLEELTARVARQAALAEQGLVAEAALLDTGEAAESGRPVTPGLLGTWTRMSRRAGSATGLLRAGLAALAIGNGRAASESPRGPGFGYGGRHATALTATATDALGDAAARGIALGSVGSAWQAELGRLEQALAAAPIDIAEQAAIRAQRPSVRRIAGLGFVYAVETLILLVLLTAAARVGTDFVHGVYAPGSVLMSVLMLIGILLVVGQTGAALFFPSPAQRLRRLVARQARALVTAAIARVQAVLHRHVEAVDRLAQEGRSLLRDIDRLIMTLAQETGAQDAGGNGDAQRLFAATEPVWTTGQQAAGGQASREQAAVEASTGSPDTRRRPVFD